MAEVQFPVAQHRSVQPPRQAHQARQTGFDKRRFPSEPASCSSVLIRSQASHNVNEPSVSPRRRISRLRSARDGPLAGAFPRSSDRQVCPRCRPSQACFGCQSRSKKGQCPGAKLDTWFDLGAHPGACAFQIADACQGALAAGQPFRSFGIFRITVWRFCSGATGSFRRSSRGYGRGGLGDRKWRL